MLRGINVGGKNKIKMDELKSIFIAIGLQDATTYIQSGNIIFTSSITDKTILKQKIQNAVQMKFNTSVPALILTGDELHKIINESPYKNIDYQQFGSKILITFLNDKPDAVKIADLLHYKDESEKCIFKNNVIYLFCPGGYGRSKLSNNFIERKLHIEATTRNWKTVNAIYKMI